MHGFPPESEDRGWTSWRFTHEPSLLHPKKTPSCVTRSAAWSHLELGPKPLLSVTSSLTHFPRCYLPVGNWEVSFLWPWIGFISSELGSECENVSYSPKRLDPWGTIHTAQVSLGPICFTLKPAVVSQREEHVEKYWTGKDPHALEVSSWCLPQDTTDWLAK